MTYGSKSLGIPDCSGFEFDKEMLAGDKTFAINFDRIQWDNKQNKYVILELLHCEEKQFKRGITPYSSHPNKYFTKNPGKWLSLWKIAQDLGAILYLVNYSSKGTEYEDEVLLMEVVDINPSKDPPIGTADKKLTRKKYSEWFRELNKRGIRQL